jgi:CheY-like chemotaxis protein
MRIEQAPDTGFLKGLAILFVDDSPDERELFELRLGTLGADVTAVESAIQALGVLERGETELLVTDIVLPELSGYDLLRAMHERPPERGGAVPALAVTGFVDTEEAMRPLSAGFDGFLAKPYSTGDLVSAIRRLTPLMARLHQLGERLATNTEKQRVLRDRLAAQRRRVRCERARLAVRRGPPAAQAQAAVTLVGYAAEDFGESYFREPVDAVEVAPVTPNAPLAGPWLALVWSHGRVLTIEVELDARLAPTVRIVDRK